jgi:hypothetical protein
MALVKGVNSYSDVTEADEHFGDKLDVDAWISAPGLQKEQSLMTATSIFEDLPWIGRIVDVSQHLAFPRVGCYFDPRLGTNVVMDLTTPKRVIVGCFDLAYHLLNNDGLMDDTGSVIDFSIGDVKLAKIQAPNRIPLHVKKHIRCLLVGGGNNNWWRAN